MGYTRKNNSIFGWEDEETLFEINKLKKSNPFAQNKRICSGIKINPFGISIHPSMKNLKISNDGLKEVVVKMIKSGSKSDMSGRHTLYALNYILSHSDSGFGIDNLGNEILLQDVLKNWSNDTSFNEIENKVGKHLVFSLPDKLTNDKNKNQILRNNLLESVKMTLWENFQDYDFVIAIHTHQSHLHAHAIVKNTHNFTKKKMHLSPSEFKTLFQYLRDDFAKYSNMFNIKDGLKYCASKKIERNIHKNRIDELMMIDDNVAERIKTKFANADAYAETQKLKQILLEQRNNNKKGIENLENTIQLLEKEAKKYSIYRYNLAKKIIEIASKKGNLDETNPKKIKIEYLNNVQKIFHIPKTMINKLEELDIKQKNINSNIKNNKNKILRLKNSNLKMWDEANDFDNLNKDVSLLQRQEKFIAVFDNRAIRNNVSKTTLDKVKIYKDEIEIAKNFLNNNLSSYINDFNTNTARFDDKTNAFELTKMLKDLNNYYKIINNDIDEKLKTYDSEQVEQLNNLNAEIKTNIERVNQLLAQRLSKLKSSYDEMEDKTKLLIKDYEMKNSSLSLKTNNLKTEKVLQRNIRNLCWIEKEFKKAMPFVLANLKSNGKDIDLNAFLHHNKNILENNIFNNLQKVYRQISNSIISITKDFNAIKNTIALTALENKEASTSGDAVNIQSKNQEPQQEPKLTPRANNNINKKI